MTRPGYDPVKAHQYYEEHKHLKGRRSGTSTNATLRRVGGTRVKTSSAPSAAARKTASQARVVRLTEKLHKLQAALQEATRELSLKRAAEQRSRQSAKKTAQKNSDGKTTAKERAASKKYRDTHKAELKAKAKKSTSSSSGSSSSTKSSTSGKKSVSDMTINELTDRVSKIRSAISDAKQQIKEANSLSHSMLVDNTDHLIHSNGSERPLTLN